MPRRCTVCDHKKRDEIDRVLVDRSEGFERIAKRYRLVLASVYRHYSEHLPATMAKAAEAKEVARADDLVGRLMSLNADTLAILAAAKDAKDHELTLKAIARAEKHIELHARLLGELGDTTTVNILVSPEWRAVQATIIAALAPFPEARMRVARAIARSVGPVAVHEMPASEPAPAKRQRQIA